MEMENENTITPESTPTLDNLSIANNNAAATNNNAAATAPNVNTTTMQVGGQAGGGRPPNPGKKWKIENTQIVAQDNIEDNNDSDSVLWLFLGQVIKQCIGFALEAKLKKNDSKISNKGPPRRSCEPPSRSCEPPKRLCASGSKEAATEQWDRAAQAVIQTAHTQFGYFFGSPGLCSGLIE